MRKLVSINGNVKNGLIHTPNQDVLAYNKERKPRFNGRYSKPGLHNLELLVADLILPKGKVNIEPDVPKRLGWVEAHNRLVGADISQKPLDAKKIILMLLILFLKQNDVLVNLLMVDALKLKLELKR